MEINFMKTIGRHENVVTMLGCCTLYPPLCLVVEYVPHGDLLHYLRDLRKTVNKLNYYYLFDFSIIRRPVVSFAAVFGMSRNAAPKWNTSCDWLTSGKECGSDVSRRFFWERCVTSDKTAAKETIALRLRLDSNNDDV